MVPSLFDLDGQACQLELTLLPERQAARDGMRLRCTIRNPQGQIVMQRSDLYVGAECDYLPTALRETFDTYLWGERWQQVRQCLKRLHADAREYAKALGEPI